MFAEQTNPFSYTADPWCPSQLPLNPSDLSCSAWIYHCGMRCGMFRGGQKSDHLMTASLQSYKWKETDVSFFKCASAFYSLCPLRDVGDMLICSPCRLLLIAVSLLLGSLIWVPVAHHYQVELVWFVSLPGSHFLSLDCRISLLTEQ